MFAGTKVKVGLVFSIATANVLVQVDTTGAQSLEYVQVTVVLPPQAFGAVGFVGLIVNIPLHPPLAVMEASQVANLILIANWVWQETSSWSEGHINTTGLIVVTVILNVQVVTQVLASVTEYVIVCTPSPAAAGSKLPALTPLPLYTPPNGVPPVSAKAGASNRIVWSDGQVTVGIRGFVTVTVKVHLAVRLAASVTVYSNTVMPTGNVEPLPRPVKSVLAVDVPEQLSVPAGTV
jgi:hypothetical protein